MAKKGLKKGATARVKATREMVFIIGVLSKRPYPYYTVPLDKKDDELYCSKCAMPYAATELEPLDV